MSTEFKLSKEELGKIAEEISVESVIPIDAAISRIIFCLSNEKRQAYAYTRLITGPYKLIAGEKQFFIVAIEEHWNKLNDEERKWVILHELHHCAYTKDGEPCLRKHDVEDFEVLLKDPKWNLDLVKVKKPKAVSASASLVSPKIK
jgi:predicted metallopeptidase